MAILFVPYLIKKLIKRPFPFVKKPSRPFGNHSITADGWRYNLKRDRVFRSPEKMEKNSLRADQSRLYRKADAIEYVIAVGLNNKLSTSSRRRARKGGHGCLASGVQVCFGILYQY